jgi:fatty-acyl-CoA synthase
MNKDFINTIYEKNSTQKGLEELFYSMDSIEKFHHTMMEDKQITNWASVFSEIANDNISKLALIEADTDKQYTYGQLESASDKICNFIVENINEYQIGLNYHNSFLFVACLLGINKANRLAILFNNREPVERQEELAISSDTKVVFGNEISGCKHFDIAQTIDINTKKQKRNSFQSSSLDEPAFVIFTSGTTGKSKGALFSHRRMLGAGIAWSLRTAMTCSDNCYIPLPLYHGNGLAVALSATFFARGCATIRIKYSTTHFFSDIEKYKCSHMCYIGELWRYILNKYKEKKETSLKVIFGNGLNKDLWEEVVNRYNIKHVVEHFGATEMPAGALTNWYNKPGYCGYLPKDDTKAKEMILVDESYKKELKEGEALFLVSSGRYRGYLDPSLDESKLVRDIRSNGDLWWKSGDLLKVNEDGFFTFIERLGDTYRYKGENVACVDVEDGIRKVKHFEEIVVYGISLPNLSGKIGMASIVTKSIDLEYFYNEITKHLPSYAIPYFIKVENQKHTTTSTLKIQKTKLAKIGIKEYATKDIYILTNNCYQKVNKLLYDTIMDGKINL